MEGTVFKQTASFEKSIFKKTNFYATEFYDFTIFINTTFKEDINFNYTTFEKLVTFQNLTLYKQIDLSITMFKEEANFLNLQNKGGDKLSTENISNRETARKIKYSFDKIGNIIEANKYYALEMEKQEQELKLKNDFKEKLVFTLHKLSSNHSQDWLLTTLWIINITFMVSIYRQTLCVYDNGLIILSLLTTAFIVSLIQCLSMLDINFKYKSFFFTVYIGLNYKFYNIITCDSDLVCFANTFNPFSKSTLTFMLLTYKIIMAYLIYQFIVSIRQNTRRN